MKKVIFLAICIVPNLIFGQDFIRDNFPSENGFIKYTDVVQVDSSLNSDHLYLNAKNWLVDAFKSSKAVIQTDDKDLKIIIVKSFISKGHNAYVTNPKNWFTMKIEVKDGRYRYTLYDIKYEFDVNVMGQSSHTDTPFEEWIRPSDKQMSDKKRQQINEALNKYCRELNDEFVSVINSLKLSMSKNENNNW